MLPVSIDGEFLVLEAFLVSLVAYALSCLLSVQITTNAMIGAFVINYVKMLWVISTVPVTQGIDYIPMAILVLRIVVSMLCGYSGQYGHTCTVDIATCSMLCR